MTYEEAVIREAFKNPSAATEISALIGQRMRQDHLRELSQRPRFEANPHVVSEASRRALERHSRERISDRNARLLAKLTATPQHVRDLSVLVGMSQSSVREALKCLEFAGLSDHCSMAKAERNTPVGYFRRD